MFKFKCLEVFKTVINWGQRFTHMCIVHGVTEEDFHLGNEKPVLLFNMPSWQLIWMEMTLHIFLY